MLLIVLSVEIIAGGCTFLWVSINRIYVCTVPPCVQKVQHALIQSVARQEVRRLLCCLMRRRE